MRAYPILGFDPVASDEAVGNEIATELRSAVRRLGEVNEVLSGSGDQRWEGRTAEAFRSSVDEELRPRIQEAYQSFTTASRAFDRWNADLPSYCRRADSLESEAAQAAQRVSQAGQGLASLNTPAPDADQAARDRYDDDLRAQRAAVAAVASAPTAAPPWPPRRSRSTRTSSTRFSTGASPPTATCRAPARPSTRRPGDRICSPPVHPARHRVAAGVDRAGRPPRRADHARLPRRAARCRRAAVHRRAPVDGPSGLRHGVRPGPRAAVVAPRCGGDVGRRSRRAGRAAVAHDHVVHRRGSPAHPDLADIDPLSVAERVLGRVAGVEQCEPFTLDDGRHGVLLAMTTSVDLASLDFDPREYLPQLDPDALGVYLCLLPVPGLEDHVGVTIGGAPNRAERAPMSFLAGQMATSLHAVADTAQLPADHVLVDATRTVHPSGFLRSRITQTPHG